MQIKNIGKEKALQKIKHYCTYQERCHKEVKEKLYSFGLYKNETEIVLSQMIEENYLNEERYAIAFAGGKFRLNHWGKIKIGYELKQKGVSEYCINKALDAIGENEYSETLNKLYKEKLRTLKEKNVFSARKKLYAYLSQKGYESNLISGIIKGLT